MNDHAEAVVLDSRGLSRLDRAGPQDPCRVPGVPRHGADFVIDANSIVEVSHVRVNMPRPRWALLPRVKVEPVTEGAAKASAELLKAAGLQGHKYAIDATVAEVALRQPGPVVVLTSDIDDMTRLCGGRVRLIGIRADGRRCPCAGPGGNPPSSHRDG